MDIETGHEGIMGEQKGGGLGGGSGEVGWGWGPADESLSC